MGGTTVTLPTKARVRDAPHAILPDEQDNVTGRFCWSRGGRKGHKFEPHVLRANHTTHYAYTYTTVAVAFLRQDIQHIMHIHILLLL